MVAFLLFAVLVIVTMRQDRIGVFGFSTSSVLTYCAALFFVVAVLHISLRSELGAPGTVVYLEYFYFLIYAAILLVSVDSILFASAINVPFIEFRGRGIWSEQKGRGRGGNVPGRPGMPREDGRRPPLLRAAASDRRSTLRHLG